jgi:citrate lyase subunit beta/citryl-CoA lyase
METARFEMTDMEPLRTALFVPGNRPDRVDKAVRAGADAVIIDLGDAVPLDLKAETRPKVRQKVIEHRDQRVFVRVNGLGTEFFQEDVDSVVVKGLDGLIAPKVESAAQLRDVHEALAVAEEKRGIAPGQIRIMPLVESAMGVERIAEIVAEKAVRDRLFTVFFGALDYTLDMGIEMTREGVELLYPRSRIAIACRAAGIAPPIDTPFMIDLRDIEALKEDAARAKALGFQGKQCIHPNQIEPCHAVFSPSREEIRRAEKIVAAFEEAEAKGSAALQLDGKFIDYPAVERARRVIRVAALLPHGSTSVLR